MCRIANIVIFLLLVTTKATAVTTGAICYSGREELCYDTIPYMVKDQAFIDGFKELSMMLKGETPYSLKRAEYIVEWAYSGGTLDYSKFCHDIDSVVYILRRFIEVNNIQRYRTAPNFALFEYFTKPNPMNGYREFRYDFNDFTGKKRFQKSIYH